MRFLRQALPQKRTISIDITNYTKTDDFAAGGYDLRQLGRLVDEVVLMGYDQHGPWENTPGRSEHCPGNAPAWRSSCMYVPSAKVMLGVAGYGYAWGPHSNYQVSDAQARALVSAAHWSAPSMGRPGSARGSGVVRHAARWLVTVVVTVVV